MAQNDLEARHLDTLDRDLGRFSALENATAYVARPLVAPGVALAFVLLAGLGAMVAFGQTDNTLIVVVAAIFGAYMALNIGANDVANNMGPAVGANALTMGGAIAIAAVFETAGALIAGGDVVSTISRGIIDPQTIGTDGIFVWAMMAVGEPGDLDRRAGLHHPFHRRRRDGRGHRRGRVRRGQLAHDGDHCGQLGDLSGAGRADRRGLPVVH
jgi:hypothetical protein